MLTTKEFLKLSKKARAIIIVKDVLQQLKDKVYNPKSQYSTNPTSYSKLKQMNTNIDAATFLRNPKSPIHCEGCARASLFISAVKFKNELTINGLCNADFGYRADGSMYEGIATKYLSNEFTSEHQAIIETAFEGKCYGAALENNMSSRKFKEFKNKRDKALIFHEIQSKKWLSIKRKEKRPTKRSFILQAICRNIIANQGVFKP